MNRHARTLVLAAVAVVGIAAPAAAAPDHSALQNRPDHPHAQVLKLHVVPVSDVGTANGYVAIDNDLDENGQQVGSDVTTCRAVPGDATAARCDVGLGLGGGLVTITFTESDASDTAYGRVTGGTGAYADAHGSVVIQEGPDGADVVLNLVR